MFVLLVIAASCNNKGNDSKAKAPAKHFPKPGTVVASAKMTVKSDTINKFTFGIDIVADSDIASGVYDIDANYEYYTTEGILTMPKGGEDFKPVIRKGTEPYTYIIGFYMPGDTTFYDYMQVSATKSQMSIKYIKAYSF